MIYQKQFGDDIHVYPMVVYIKDIKKYNSVKEFTLPKVHVGFCSTLNRMTNQNRFARYVGYHFDEKSMTSDTNPKFKINFIEYNQVIEQDKLVDLNVCRDCLDLLRWQNYRSRGTPTYQKDKIVNEFLFKTFFEKYQKIIMPKTEFTADNSPHQIYTDDWDKISFSKKLEVGFKCQSCGVDLSEPHLRKYLHTHHINHNPADNSPRNLKPICIKCHADIHSHMKNHIDYEVFLKLNLQGFNLY